MENLFLVGLYGQPLRSIFLQKPIVLKQRFYAGLVHFGLISPGGGLSRYKLQNSVSMNFIPVAQFLPCSLETFLHVGFHPLLCDKFPGFFLENSL
jgi:hypothetical protein